MNFQNMKTDIEKLGENIFVSITRPRLKNDELDEQENQNLDYMIITFCTTS